MKYIVTAIILFAGMHAIAQTLQGTVKDTEDVAVFATVQVIELRTGVTTDEHGNYSLKLPVAGEYTIKFSALGYTTYQTKIQVAAGELKWLTVILKQESSSLKEVTVTGSNQVRQVREQAYAVSSIDAKLLHNTTKDINQMLNYTTGIRIRESGGLGSDYSFSLNGFVGKQVKFFLDGVPIENFGSSMSLNNLPVNLAERIEVYKGVVPIWLGSDALGGAVNVITNQQIKNYMDVSYSLGTFNTHRTALSTRLTWKATGLILNVNAFYNYSDNNYKVDVQIPDEQTGRYGPEISLRRFHDAYYSSMGQVEAGFANKKFADKLMIGIIASENKKDIQTGLNMEEVSGMAFNSSKSIIPTLKYKKKDLFIRGLSLTLNAFYSMVESGITDTSSREYDWFGNYTVKTFGVTSGEISYNKTLFRFNDKNVLTTANVSYEPGKYHSFGMNYTFNQYRREGEDPISRYPIPFDKPNILKKNVAGFAYKYSSLNEKLSFTAFTKLFRFSAAVVEAEWGEYAEMNSEYTRYGYGLASVYRLSPSILVKASYESTWRLPDGEEMFGNGLLLQNNPGLRPEHSHNVNAGIITDFTFGKHRIESELGLIYRRSGDYIRLESDGILSNYSNLDSVRTMGIEWAGKYTLNNFLSVTLNGTWQNIININKYDQGIKSFIYLDQLPNIPYLFGNAEISSRFKGVFSKSDNLNITLAACYVEEFYLFWPSQGNTGSKFTIPTQFTQNAGVTYSLKKGTYNISFECNNLSNAKVYDNFRLQKPGRSFQVKFRYFIH